MTNSTIFFTNFDVKYLQQMVLQQLWVSIEKVISQNLFLRVNPNVLTSLKTEQTVEKKYSRKPKWFFFLILLTLVLSVSNWIYNEVKQPAEEQIHTKTIEAQRLESLTEKVKSGELSESEWNELCDLLASVKGIHVNDCDNCRHYIRALLGGRNKPLISRYLNTSEKELLKGINSYQKQIDKHIRKILTPKEFYPNWDNLPEANQIDLINNKWPKEIEGFKEQKQIFECILKNR